MRHKARDKESFCQTCLTFDCLGALTPCLLVRAQAEPPPPQRRRRFRLFSVASFARVTHAIELLTTRPFNVIKYRHLPYRRGGGLGGGGGGGSSAGMARINEALSLGSFFQ